MKCKLCGTAFNPGEDKFCQSCGRELPQVSEAQSTPATTDTLNTGPSTAIGKNSILSNSQIHTTTTTTHVNNTTIEDHTKKTIVCAVSGKRVLYTESVSCRGCNNDVSLEYYNPKTKKCENCHQEYLQQYRVAVGEAMASEGIDRKERSDLDILANKLQLTDSEKLLIEDEIKANYANTESEEGVELDDLFEVDFNEVKKSIFKKNDLSSGLLKLKQIYDQVQTNDEVASLYFLVKALINPTLYLTNYESKSFEDYWQNYWYFLAQLSNGDKERKGYNNFKKNYNKHKNRKDEIILSEIIYLVLTYQTTLNDGYLNKANDKLLEVENISSGLLNKLFKTTQQIVSSFDFVDQKYTNLIPPEEPGMKEYFLFFINHLYKIRPEEPKIDKTISNEIKDENRKVDDNSHKLSSSTNSSSSSQISDGQKTNKPSLPPLPLGATSKPVLPTVPKSGSSVQWTKTNSEKSTPNHNSSGVFDKPKLPLVPGAPKSLGIVNVPNKVPTNNSKPTSNQVANQGKTSKPVTPTSNNNSKPPMPGSGKK